MMRGVSQLLFNYLPERTVDWEGGLAIVRLGGVQLRDCWPGERARVVLDEIAHLLNRWRSLGGTVDPMFPDPQTSPGRFTLGTPKGIDASILDSAYQCQRCQALSFPRHADLANPERPIASCCETPVLRQFGQVFVHGCGELIPLQAYIPGARLGDDGVLEATRRRLRCPNCGDRGVLTIPARSERVVDMRVVCRICGMEVLDRLTARCPRCTPRVAQEQRSGGGPQGLSPVARIAMRMSRYSANDTYYAQSVTILRLDRPALTTQEDPEQRLLRALLPIQARPSELQSPAAVLAALTERLRRAEALGDAAEEARIRERIVAVATGGPMQEQGAQDVPPPPTAPDMEKAIRESLAFRTTVNTRPALALAQEGRAGQLLAGRTAQLQRSLGLRELLLVDDLPVISATYGYTRRSFQPTYEELQAQLPTELRVFPSLNNFAAERLGRQDLVGTVPVLAREGEHQGLFVSLDPDLVVDWLGRNRITLPDNGPPLHRIITALEPVDRYYDQIWDLDVRRLVFGLVHSFSHAVMRTVSCFAGLERTSLSEYLFLPLLGTVVFDNSGAFQLGGIESLVRDHLTAFLEQLPSEAMTCVYDAECIDAEGACHGCIHSPEIACRVFNHGLSRSFLIGGHVPWRDIADDRRLAGYWQLGDRA